MTSLGIMEPVDLRRIWETEAGDFTPWLARECNLNLLADTIGVELELEAQEKNVGPFRADILCKDLVTGHWVLIENQLERTDHRHLGQLLTYAAGLKAVTIVWIADEFTDEHRAALDWLNEITDDRFNFFGLEIELWKIGESAIAPKFNVVGKPNDWSRTISGAAKQIEEGSLTETKLLQQEYWSALRNLLLTRKSDVKPQKPRPQHWTSFALGRTHFALHATVNSIKNSIAANIGMTGPDARAHFHLLHDDKDSIELEVGASLEWEELPNRKESRISLRQHEADPTKKAGWPSQHEWLAGKLESLHAAFSPRVKMLDVNDYLPTT